VVNSADGKLSPLSPSCLETYRRKIRHWSENSRQRSARLYSRSATIEVSLRVPASGPKPQTSRGDATAFPGPQTSENLPVDALPDFNLGEFS